MVMAKPGGLFFDSRCVCMCVCVYRVVQKVCQKWGKSNRNSAKYE